MNSAIRMWCLSDSYHLVSKILKYAVTDLIVDCFTVWEVLNLMSILL